MIQTLTKSFRSPNRRHNRQFFYKYVTAEVAKIILVTRKLRWSSPLLFNDPFDISQELRLNFDEEKLNKVFVDNLASIIEGGIMPCSVKDPRLAVMLEFVRNSPPEVRRALIHDLRQEFKAPKIGQIQALEEIKQTWRNTVPTFRVLCLSELNDVTPMWNHYSESYKGAVLEFEAIDKLDSAFLVAHPVIYQDTPPAIADPEEWVQAILGQFDIKNLFDKNLYVKTTDWSYEKEWRIVSAAKPSESGLFADYEFHPHELTAIYFGPKCPSEQKTDMLKLLDYGLEHVRAYEAIADTQKAIFTFTPLSR